MREARNDGAPSCYASKMHSAPLGLPPPTYDSLLSPHKAKGRSAISASHTYHLRGSINSAALREKSVRLCKRKATVAGYFFSPSRRGRKGEA